MAHLQNYSRGAINGILRHDERQPSDNVKERKNECINPTKTHLNYNLAPTRNTNPLEYIQNTCENNNINLNKRKDLNIMSSWVITKPIDVDEQEQEKFFEECYNFLSTRYGQKSILSACIHLDETTPHIHFCFIPIAYDKKNNRETVSAKLRLNRTELRNFHKDLNKHIEKALGHTTSIITGITEQQGGNMTKEQLQAQELLNNIKKLKQEKKSLQEDIKTMQRTRKPLQEPKTLESAKSYAKRIQPDIDKLINLEVKATKLANKLQDNANSLNKRVENAENQMYQMKHNLTIEKINEQCERTEMKELISLFKLAYGIPEQTKLNEITRQLKIQLQQQGLLAKSKNPSKEYSR